MKRKLLTFVATVLLLVNGLSFVGCDLYGDFNEEKGGEELPQIDNAADLKEFTPTEGDDSPYLEDQTYYMSEAIDLVTEINGNYTVDRPFTLDEEDENKRIYHNIYFYVGDFFQVIYYKDVTDLGILYAVLSDASDQEYAEIEYTPQGAPLQINIKKQGVYNLILDIETLAIDMVKVGDIDTPVYETIRTCELYVHVAQKDYSYSEMVLNEETNEYYIQKEIPQNASIGFFNASHTGRYNMTVNLVENNTYFWWDWANPERVRVHVGGTYDVYFNAKTYVLRLELKNPETANYYCQVGWQEGKVLSAVSNDAPYLFEYNFVAQGTPQDPYVSLPSFYPELGMSYDLYVIDEDELTWADCVKEAGTYKLTVNLKEFTLTVKRLS